MHESSPTIGTGNPAAAGLLLQFLAWVAARPRTYGEAMDAWRTSCPRLSVWEDAVSDGLVQVEAGEAARKEKRAVLLTAAGISVLRAAAGQ
jgi:hypothetical protein